MARNTTQIRPPAVAGQFYAGDADALRSELGRLFGSIRPCTTRPEVVGLIAPHAGYCYSGRVAAAAYGCLDPGAYDAVVVVGPSHREAFGGGTLYPGRAYGTPLGEVPVDHELAQAIVAESHGSLRYDVTGHRLEHSVEVQLPFLQYTLGEFSAVPVVLGALPLDACEAAGHAVAAACESVRAGRVLLVASSDLSHFHPLPEARRMDGIVREHLSAFDAEALARTLIERKCEACGAIPVLTAMAASRALGAASARVTAYATSADAGAGEASVVGYLSALLCRSIA